MESLHHTMVANKFCLDGSMSERVAYIWIFFCSFPNVHLISRAHTHTLAQRYSNLIISAVDQRVNVKMQA